MIRSIVVAVGLALALLTSSAAEAADDEVALFDGTGNATAYIAMHDDLTIYLWTGKPVAYLDDAEEGSFSVYGFNGEHLGWFSNGVVWNHTGAASCAVRERIRLPQLEPLKGLKELKPLKGLKVLRPLRPLQNNSFGESCAFLLVSGSK